MRRRVLSVVWFVVLSAMVSVAADVTVFGPETFARGTGEPRAVTRTFSVSSLSGPYLLRVANNGVTNALISVNGQTVLSPDDFKVTETKTGEKAEKSENGDDGDFVPSLERPVTLRAGTNQIAVELRGKPGLSLTLQIVNTGAADTTPPTITAAASPPPNANHWNNSPVTVTFTCTDAGSGIATCPPPVTVGDDGATQVVTGKATDNAGNTATTSVTLNIDQAPPIVTASQSPSANANGWNNGPVTVTFAATDALSGVAPDSLTAPATLSTDGSNLSASGQATDLAGNVGPVTRAGINIDQVQPSITVALSEAPNAKGWVIGPVTAHFDCGDPGSGIAICPSDQIVSADGEGRTVSGTATDNAGNTRSVTSAAFNVDHTKPTITVALSPAPRGSAYSSVAVTAHFICDDTVSGVASCPPDQVVSSDGAGQTVTGSATDLAGNTESVTSDPFNIDRSAPSITVTLDPAPNTNGWNNSPVTAHFTCTDAGGSGVVSCPANQVFSSGGANQSVSGMAIDGAGNTEIVSTTVNLDRTPPELTFASPVNGAFVFTPTLTATGTVTDDLSGVAGVTCDGAQAMVSGTTVGCGVTLARGPNSIAAVAEDLAGNRTSFDLGLNYSRVPVVKITSPDNLGYLNVSPTTVSGTVDDDTAQVTINSIPAPAANGSFSIALPLAEGPNVITASASTNDGAVGTASVAVTLDTTPPRVTVTSPPDQFVTTDDSITVSGNVNDIVVGTVNDQQAQVRVNGLSAQVGNRTFVAANVPLAVGPNDIDAVATDRVGNFAHATRIRVTRQVLTQAQIRAVSGNNQTAPIGAALSAPLVVALTDATGQPSPNTSVIFKVAQNDGLMTAGGSPAATVVTTTDAQGHAHVTWMLGNRAGAGGNSVEAYSVGYEGTALFTATGTQGAAGKIVVDTGNDQIGAVGQALPKPFIAVVVDGGSNRLAGAPVTFTVQQGGGSFDGRESFSAITDSDGRVAATLTLGLQEGNANNLVTATFPTNLAFPVAFTASGRAPGDPAATTIAGVVLDNSNVPIPGVTIRAVLTNVLHSSLTSVQSATAVQTDAQGQFSISQAPIGFVKLLVDGSTAQLPGAYPSLEYDVVTVAGQVNTVGQPMYLLALNTANQLCVSPTEPGGTLTIPEAPGFSLTFGFGQVTFPGGSQTGCVSVTIVHGDKVPMVPGFGQQPRFIVTIQPSGAVFSPPAPITLPNVDGLKPREVTEMYSFDHDIGSFVAIGTGVVSDDGQVIRSSAGVGVLKAGWHCGGNPAPTGSAAECGACKTCVTDHCEADPSQNGQQVPDDKCKVCKGGEPTEIDLTTTGVEVAYTFSPPSAAVDKINEILEKLRPLGVIASVNLLQVTGKVSTKECCGAETGKGHETSGSVSGNFGGISVKVKVWPPGPIPTFGPVTLDVIGIVSLSVKAEFVGGVFLGVTINVTGEVGYKKKDCSEDPADLAGCFNASLKATLTPSVSAEFGGSASLTIDCFFCDKTTISIEASLLIGELSWPIDITGVTYNKDSCSAGLAGGIFNPQKGEFKISAKFSGKYKTELLGEQKLEATFEFLKCEITLSSVECK
jgi:hypothetical protein